MSFDTAGYDSTLSPVLNRHNSVLAGTIPPLSKTPGVLRIGAKHRVGLGSG
jgi:hypothetical protein